MEERARETLKECPVCKGNEYEPFLTCKDHTVSQEEFDIVECKNCGFRFTNPRPTPEVIGDYYKAEEYISHSNTKKGLINTLYHWVRSYTLRKKHRLALSLNDKKPGRILDHGCGTGEFLDHCRKEGWEVTGLEPDEDARDFAFKEYGLEVDDPERISQLPDDQFDVVTLWHVLEHVPDLNGTVSELKRVLAPSGSLVIAVPNCSSLDAEIYGEFWAAYDVPRHLYHFRPKNINDLFGNYGMEVQEVRPMKFDSFYVSMLSEKYKGGTIFKGPIIGLRSNLAATDKNKRYSSQMYLINK